MTRQEFEKNLASFLREAVSREDITQTQADLAYSILATSEQAYAAALDLKTLFEFLLKYLPVIMEIIRALTNLKPVPTMTVVPPSTVK